MLTLDSQAKLKQSLILHESLAKFPYVDTVGKVTIGIGYNLTDRGMPDDWINSQYQADATYFYNQLNTFPWFQNLNEDRQIALVDMCWMGWERFLEFKEMISYLAVGNYSKAAYEMLNSEWAKEVKTRAATLAQVMLSGVYQL
jgi:lysozyme